MKLSTVQPPDQRDVRMLLVQWAGDYSEAYRRLYGGGAENYYAQRYSIDSAGALSRQYKAYGVLCLSGSARVDEVMGNGVRAMNAGLDMSKPDFSVITEMVVGFNPTHLVLTTPNPALLEWGINSGIDVLPQFADTFLFGSDDLSLARRFLKPIKHAMKCRRLARALNSARVRWVGNHNVNACRDLVRIGVSPKKVVPWDWPSMVKADDYEPKRLPGNGAVTTMVFVGVMNAKKGVGDAIGAIAELRRRGRVVRLRVIGPGDIEPFRRQARDSGVMDSVDFEGPRSHDDVIAAMRDAQLALVPSWHSFPEALPMTIYEALAVRTPLICSDHPAFASRIGHGTSSISVPQRSPAAIADAAERLLTDPERYHRMSEATAVTWKKLACPVAYYDLIRRWAAGSPEDDEWLAKYNLASGRYD